METRCSTHLPHSVARRILDTLLVPSMFHTGTARKQSNAQHDDQRDGHIRRRAPSPKPVAYHPRPAAPRHCRWSASGARNLRQAPLAALLPRSRYWHLPSLQRFPTAEATRAVPSQDVLPYMFPGLPTGPVSYGDQIAWWEALQQQSTYVPDCDSRPDVRQLALTATAIYRPS